MLDALQKLNDEPLTDCPECNSAALKRLISAPAFRLNGGGWYETDFKSDKEKRRNLADGPKGEAADGAGKAKDEKAGKDAKTTAKDAKPVADAGKAKAAEKPASSKGSGTGSEAA
jgi:putative FmdB family regulatory protein